jgi:hypothetical protein
MTTLAPEKVVGFNAVLMTDRRVMLTESDVDELVVYIKAENAKRQEAGLPLIPVSCKEDLNSLSQDDKKLFPVLDRFFNDKRNSGLNFVEEEGGTGFNTEESLYAATGNTGQVKVLRLPMTNKYATAYVFVLPNGHAVKAALRPEGDIDYTNLDPKTGLGKEIKELDAFVFIKSVTIHHKDGNGALLVFMKKHNPKAPIIALVNGSDDPTNPRAFLEADIWFATRKEIQRPEYDGIREEFFKMKNFLLVLLDGDSGENGYHIVTPDMYLQFPPDNVNIANSAGARDGAAAALIAQTIDMLDTRLLAPYHLDALGHLMPVMAGEIMKRKETTMPRGVTDEILNDYAAFVGRQMANRQAVRNFCDSLTPKKTPSMA